MPSGNDIVTAKQVVPQRAAVDSSSRRDAAEPIGRDFADLLAEARASETEKPGSSEKPNDNKAQNSSASSQGPKPADADNTAAGQEASASQGSFSTEPPEGNDPAAYLVANATLSEASTPVAGILNLSPQLPTEKTKNIQSPTASETAGDVVVDTAALFATPTTPTSASQPAELGDASAPATETTATAQTIAAPAALTAAGNGLRLTASTQLNAPAEPVQPGQPAAQSTIEGGPGANRFDANLARGNGSETQTAQPGHPAQSSQSASSGAQAKVDAQPTGQTGAAQAAAALAAAPDANPSGNLSNPSPLSATSPTTVTSASGAAHPTPASSPAHAPPPALASAPQAALQVYTRFVERFDGRAQQFQIRLDPPELGRVNVRIEIGSDHRVHAVLSAHDSNALSDLLRGQRALEQSLADAGIDLAEDGIRFELSDNGAQQSSAGEQNEAGGRSSASMQVPEATAPAQSDAPPPRWSRSRINIVA